MIALLDGILMNVASTAENGKIDSGTIFRFTQVDEIVSAQYAGGAILEGHLIGTLRDDALTFSYVQVDRNHVIDAGRSECTVRRLDDGRIEVTENFEWSSQDGSGTNVLVQSFVTP